MRGGSRVGGSLSRCCSASWAGPLLARYLRRAGELRRQARASGNRGAEAVLAGLCQRAPALGAVPSGLLSAARALSDGGGAEKFRFKNKLLSLDTTVIDLCADVFPWATFRRRKGAVKLHFTLDHDGYLPTAPVITEGKRHDMTVARQQPFEAGTVLVFDMAYIDYAWLAHLHRDGVTFVTRCRGTRPPTSPPRARSRRGVGC